MESLYESPPLFSPLVVTLIAIAALVGTSIIIAIAIKTLSRKKTELLGMSREDIRRRWQAIEDLMKRDDEMSFKLAVLEADKLLDHGLKAMGFGGTSLGERLKLAVYKFPKLRSVWSAHLVRNKLVHEASYQLHRNTATRAIAEFKRALQELGII